MHCSCAVARGNALGAIRAGTGNVLSFYVNSTRQNPNPSRKKSTVPQDYYAGLILCGQRGAISQSLTVRDLSTNYNFMAKTSIYKVKR